jgi:hypothetical protein
MQRDILVAFWLLFDEFEIGDDCPPPEPLPAHAPTAAPPPTSRPPRAQNRKADRSA